MKAPNYFKINKAVNIDIVLHESNVYKTIMECDILMKRHKIRPIPVAFKM